MPNAKRPSLPRKRPSRTPKRPRNGKKELPNGKKGLLNTKKALADDEKESTKSERRAKTPSGRGWVAEMVAIDHMRDHREVAGLERLGEVAGRANLKACCLSSGISSRRGQPREACPRRGAAEQIENVKTGNFVHLEIEIRRSGAE